MKGYKNKMAEENNKKIEDLSKQNVTESKSIKESQIKSEEVLSTNLPGLKESSQKHRDEDKARFQRQKRRERIRFAINTARYFKDKLAERKIRKIAQKRFLFENKQRLFIADKQQKNIDATILVAKSVNDLGTQMAGNDLLNEERRREQNALFSKLLNKDEKDRPELRKGLLDGLGKGLLIAAALTGILAATGNLESAVQGWVQGGINFAKNVTKKLVEKLSAFKEGAKGLGKSFTKAFRGVTRSFRRGMNSAVGGITKKLTGALGKLKGGIDDVVSGLKSKVGSITKTLTQKLAKSGIGTAAKKAGGFFSKVAGGVKAAGSKVAGVASKAVGGVKAAGSKVAGAAKGVLGAPVTKFIKGSAGKIIKVLGRVPVLGGVIEGIFANSDIKALLANPELSASEKQKAVGSRVLEAFAGPTGAALAVAALNVATGGAGFLGSFIAAAGGDFAGRFIARQLAKVLPLGLLGKTMINTFYGGIPEEGAEGGGTSVSGIAKGAVSAVSGAVGGAASTAMGVTKGAAAAAPAIGAGYDSSKLNDSQNEHLSRLKKSLSGAKNDDEKFAIIRKFDAERKRIDPDGELGFQDEEFLNAVRLTTTQSFDREAVKRKISGTKTKDENEHLSRLKKSVTKPSNSGAQMESGMSNISEQRSRPAPVVVSGGGGGAGPQNTTVNSSNVVVSNSKHIEESFALTTGGYAIG
jgi:hypothetical protein